VGTVATSASGDTTHRAARAAARKHSRAAGAAGWVTDYSTTDFAYRVNLSARACCRTHYLGEAVPHVAPDLAPNCLALYLGCKGVETVGTVWCKPCMTSPETARFKYCPDNFYWTSACGWGASSCVWATASSSSSSRT